MITSIKAWLGFAIKDLSPACMKPWLRQVYPPKPWRRQACPLGALP